MVAVQRIGLALFLSLGVVLLQARPASASAFLLHSYTFTGNVTDQVGTANGTLMGGATAAGVLALDGVNDFVQFASHIVPTSGSYAVTLIAQELGRSGTYAELISQGFSGSGFYFGHDPVDVIRASDGWISTGVPFSTDALWHHYALVVDSSVNTSRLFIDGTLRATHVGLLANTTGGTDTRLGNQFAPFNEFFNGNMDNLNIYSGALSDLEVAALAEPTAVPEPASLLLLGSGLIAVQRRLRRRG